MRSPVCEAGLITIVLFIASPLSATGPSRRPLDTKEREAVLTLLKSVDLAQEVDAASDTTLAFDAVTITRPENRSELAYVMLLRRITIGGPGSELVVSGARTRTAIEIAQYAGRWIWRPTGPSIAWKPLVEGTELDCGGKLLRATAGSYTHF